MRVLKWIGGLAGFAALIGLTVGVLVGAPVADGVDRYFSSNKFCANTCHVMTATVAAELKESAHGTTKTGVVPQCKDCHISENLLGAYVDHIKGTRDLYSSVIKGIDTVEEFEGIRFDAANRVRMDFVANDSENCRSCHVMEKIQPERTRGQRQHVEAKEKNITCIVCHYDLVHKSSPLSDEFEAVVSSY
ncbi:NapC/NirT family cytochrome c [Sediminimonas sp.]|uniref:NapC/NirT family cytochrome c n=1 Tax=Sediminimonas sp. TaxID=2823379 RepID=UPI0025E18EE2|nr:NapC/NirT family cytochrome c [Sediminimonas sp.]